MNALDRFLLLTVQEAVKQGAYIQAAGMLAAAVAVLAAGPVPASVSGDVEHKISVRTAIGKNFGSLASCLEDFSDSHPEVKEVDLEFLVWTDGRFYNVKMMPGDEEAEECIESLLKGISVPFPQNPKDYNFKIDLDAHVRHVHAKGAETRKDGIEETGTKKKKRMRRHNLSLDLLTPIVTSAMSVGTVFVFEYEIAVNRWVALSFTGVAGKVSRDEKITIRGRSYEGTVEGRGGGGGGGVRVFPLGNANRGLLLGTQVRAYVFKLALDDCPPQAEKGQCSGELKNLDLMVEAGWRFVMPFGLSIQLSAEVGAQFGRSLYRFESDPAPWFGGRAAVGWAF